LLGTTWHSPGGRNATGAQVHRCLQCSQPAWRRGGQPRVAL